MLYFSKIIPKWFVLVFTFAKILTKSSMNKFIHRGLLVLCVLMLQHLGGFSQRNSAVNGDLLISQSNSGLQFKSNATDKPMLPILAVALEEVDEEVSTYKKCYKFTAFESGKLFVSRAIESSTISRKTTFNFPVESSHVPLYLLLQVFRIWYPLAYLIIRFNS